MAKTTKTSVKSATKVTRITAKDDTPKKSIASPDLTPKKDKKDKKADKKSAHQPVEAHKKAPIFAIINYFKGSWYELRQVRWPDRATTWKMTGVLLLFTAVFTTIILLLDAGFKYLFQVIIGR